MSEPLLLAPEEGGRMQFTGVVVHFSPRRGAMHHSGAAPWAWPPR